MRCESEGNVEYPNYPVYYPYYPAEYPNYPVYYPNYPAECPYYPVGHGHLRLTDIQGPTPLLPVRYWFDAPPLPPLCPPVSPMAVFLMGTLTVSPLPFFL